MKIKPFTIAFHALIWGSLLIIPYATAGQVFKMFDPENFGSVKVPSLLLSIG